MRKLKIAIREFDYLRFFAMAVVACAIAVVALRARADSDKEAYVIKDLTTQTQDDGFTLSFALDRPYQGEELPIDFIHQTIQVNIPNAQWEEGHKRSDLAHDEVVEKVVTFQRPSGDVRTQLILRKGLDAKQMESRVHIIKENNNLIVKIDRETTTRAHKIESLPAVAPVAIESIGPATIDDKIQSAANELAQAPVAATAPAIAENIGEKKESEILLSPAIHAKASGIQPLQRVLLALAITLSIGLAVLYSLRKYRKRNDGTIEATKIKVLNQHHLGPKKSLAIIRVAGESILIGVTDHNISMIKSLSLLDEDLPDALPAHFSNELLNLPPLEYGDVPDSFSIKGLNEVKSLVSKRFDDMGKLR